jgi:hypothetical protein
MRGIVWQRLRIIRPMRLPRHLASGLACTGLLVLAACAPALDWRDVRAADGVVKAQLPCKPTTHTRKVALAGQAVALSLHACSAGGQTWALAWGDVTDPAQVGPALRELRDAAAANIGAQSSVVLKLSVPGATPHADSTRLLLEGKRADGHAVREQIALFARGTVVVQATALGAELPDDAADTFFASLRAGS